MLSLRVQPLSDATMGYLALFQSLVQFDPIKALFTEILLPLFPIKKCKAQLLNAVLYIDSYSIRGDFQLLSISFC
jgi:hypothetical protein